MTKYDYKEEVKQDVFEMLKENYMSDQLSKYAYKDGSDYFVEFDDDFKNEIMERAFNCDSVTGNMSGSYFCDRQKAKECFEENNGIEILNTALFEGLISKENITDYFMNNDFESLDVICRCVVCPEAAYYAIDDFEIYLIENEGLLLKKIYIENGGEEE